MVLLTPNLNTAFDVRFFRNDPIHRDEYKLLRKLFTIGIPLAIIKSMHESESITMDRSNNPQMEVERDSNKLNTSGGRF